MKRRGSLSVLVSLLALSACESEKTNTPRPPEGPPHIRGTITAIDRDRVLIEENPHERSGSAKAWLRVSAETVLRFRATGAPATFADLRIGRVVQAWTSGPVAESYPVQGTAAMIEVDP